MRSSGRSLSELAGAMPRFPQTMINVRIDSVPELDSGPVAAVVESVEQRLGDRGRVVLRPSGTEPLIRVMVEGEDEAEVVATAEEIAAAVRAASGHD
jgi:phosphoglucosamine mutase